MSTYGTRNGFMVRVRIRGTYVPVRYQHYTTARVTMDHYTIATPQAGICYAWVWYRHGLILHAGTSQDAGHLVQLLRRFYIAG